MRLAWILCLVLSMGQSVKPKSILYLSMPQSVSHRRSFYQVARTLQARGHFVTILAETVSDDGKRLGDCGELRGMEVEEWLIQVLPDSRELQDAFLYLNSSLTKSIIWESNNASPLGLAAVTQFMNGICQATLAQAQHELDEVVLGRSWDLVIVDDILNTCGVGLAYRIHNAQGAPLALFSTTTFYASTSYFAGIPYHPLLVASANSPNRFHIHEFVVRLEALGQYLGELYTAVFPVNRIYSDVGRRMDPTFPDLPGFYALMSAKFSEVPEWLEPPRPQVRGAIAAGSYCSAAAPKPLPEDLATFVNAKGSRGLIYLAFGTNVRWEMAPTDILLSFSTLATRLKSYRIVWQYSGPRPSFFPPNVYLSPWLPQYDILAHPKTRLFITHGGLKSIREGLCAGVPMVLVPLFADQKRNAWMVEAKGAGLVVEKHHICANSLHAASSVILQDSKFRLAAERYSRLVSDLPISGPAHAAFWADLVARRRTLPPAFFRNAALSLPLPAFLGLDWLAALALPPLLLVLILRTLCRRP